MTDTALVWGVRASFVAYVEAQPDGRIVAASGAERTPDGRFRFTAAAGDDATAFRGTVRFTAHGGVLDMAVTDPAIAWTDGGAVLTTAVGSAGERCAFATLHDLRIGADGSVTADDVAVTDDGAFLLGGVYATGAALDPLTTRTTVAS